MRRGLVFHFIASFLPFSLVLGGAVFLFSWRQAERRMEDIRLGEAFHVEVAARTLVTGLETVVSDLLILADGHALRDLVDGHRTAEAVAEEFALFSRRRQAYDQIRYIDKMGDEVIRVNFGGGVPYVVPKDQLQNKADRYYVIESMALRRGMIYVSPLDLNVENGEVERPFKPMIRFAMPVFDSAGHKAGVVVLNHFGDGLLDRLEDALRGALGKAMLLNAEGYWMLSPIKEDEWGFMLDRADARLPVADPEGWAELQAENGQFRTDRGLYTFATLSPLKAARAAARRHNAVATGGYEDDTGMPRRDWKVVSFVPESELLATVKAGHAFYGVFFLLGLAIIIILSASFAWVRDRQLASESALRLAARVRDVTSDAVVIADRDGTILSINQAFTSITGFQPHEAVGRSMAFVRARRKDEDWGGVLEAVRQTGQWQGELWCRRKNGQTFPAETMVNLIRTRDNEHNIIEIFADIGERKARENHLERLAHHDALTGLPNRTLFTDRLDMALANALRHKTKFALFYVDLDKFKPVNDEHGHETGDEVLKEVASRLSSAVRRYDTVARLGGDEFAVIVHEVAGIEEATQVADKLRQEMDVPISVGDLTLHLGASIGVVLFPDHATDPEMLLRFADTAMYAAKRTGGGIECGEAES